MKQKKLILHIGTHKTGTTSIQNTLQKNCDQLSKYGVYYPKEHPNNHSISLYSLFLNEPEDYFFIKQFFNLNSKKELYKKIEELKTYWKSQFEKFMKSEYDCFIVSGEDFEFLPRKGKLNEFLEFIKPYFDDIKIIVYFREPKAYMLSAIQQNIKFGKTSFSDMEERVKNRLCYKNMLKSYSDTFGEQNIAARVFDRKLLINGDIIDDFLDAAGYGNIKIVNENKVRLNESLGLYSATFLSERNKSNVYEKGEKEYINFHLANARLVKIMKKIEEPKLKFDVEFSNEQVDRINEEYKFVNRYIRKENRFKQIQYYNEKIEYPSMDDIPNEYILKLIDETARQSFSSRKDILMELYAARRNSKFVKLRNIIYSLFIRKHEMFDEEFYKNKYIDIKTDPLKHFFLFGAYEGKNPNADFYTCEYIRRNADIVFNAENPIIHSVKKRKAK